MADQAHAVVKILLQSSFTDLCESYLAWKQHSRRLAML